MNKSRLASGDRHRGGGGIIPECASSGVPLRSASILWFTFAGRIRPTAVLQSSLEILSPTPYPMLVNCNQKMELNMLGNIHYVALCNGVITVLYMLNQRLTEN